MTHEIRRLEPSDDRSGFRSGDPDLDRFFQRFAGQNQFRHHIGTTYVAVRGGAILGYVTLAPSHIEAGSLPRQIRRRLPVYPVPVLRLARLAVDERFQGEGIGESLLRAVLLIGKQMAIDVGCLGVLVDAKPRAVALYERFGFALEVVQGALGDRPEPVVMFLALASIPDA